MLRARRLKQIADSNKPVFSSTETEWWLAEAPVKPEKATSGAPDKSIKTADRKTEMPSSSNSPAADAVAAEPVPVHANSTYDFLFLKDPSTSVATKTTKREEMTWDAKMSCFVMS